MTRKATRLDLELHLLPYSKQLPLFHPSLANSARGELQGGLLWKATECHTLGDIRGGRHREVLDRNLGAAEG